MKSYLFTSILFTVTALLAGCMNAYSYKGTTYQLKEDQGMFLQRLEVDMEAKRQEWRESGKSPGEALMAECKLLLGRIKYAPGSTSTVSAKGIVDMDADDVCAKADQTMDAERAERRRVAQEENERKNAEIRARNDEERRQRQKAREEADKEHLAYKAQLQKTVWEIGKTQCQVVDWAEVGERLEDDNGYGVGTTAAGTFAGGLLKCVNNGKKTVHMTSDAFTLVDGQGRQYAIDTQGSLHYAMFYKSENHQNPQFVELHPGLVVYIALVYDVPPDVLADKKLHLRIGRKAKYPLVIE